MGVRRISGSFSVAAIVAASLAACSQPERIEIEQGTVAAVPAAAPEPGTQPETRPETEPPPAPEPTELDRKLAAHVSFAFQGASATDVLGYLAAARELEVAVDPAIVDSLAHVPVSLRLLDVPVGAALRAIARVTDTGLCVRDGVPTLTTVDAADPPSAGSDAASPTLDETMARTTSVNFVETRADDVCQYLGRAFSVNVVIDANGNDEIEDTPISIARDDASLRALVDAVALALACRVEIADDIVFLVAE